MIEEQVISILEERLSSLTARTLVTRCSAAIGIRPPELDEQHLPKFVRELEVGVRLFVKPEHQRTLMHRIRALGPAPKVQEITIPIESESDVGKARTMARNAAVDLGASSFTAQKVMTAVSELARNIALYAGSGHIDLIPLGHPEVRIRIVAADQGPGIADVRHVLSGRYKSKTGLGRGLLSLRRMADGFDVKTSPEGTQVQVEFVL